MLITISPAKKLTFTNPAPISDFTMPALLDKASELITIMCEKDSFEIADLMKISMKLADLNAERYQQWHTPFTPENAKQALFAFAGDVYQGLDAATLKADEIEYAQDHLRILSGLYGVLRPLDLMQPYRLEMGTKLATAYGRNLYQFWGDLITEQLNQALTGQHDDILINLASTEYFSAVNRRKLNGRIITPVFKELRNGTYRIISFNAKKARGLMSRYIISNRIDDPEAMKQFDLADYHFSSELSEDDQFVFIR